jgi:hypothetical protein
MMLAPPLPIMPPTQLAKPVVGLVLVWSGDPAAGRRAIAPLLGAARPVAELVRPVPYLAIQSMLDGGARRGATTTGARTGSPASPTRSSTR